MIGCGSGRKQIGKLVQSEAQKTQASPINQSSKGPVETLIPFIRLFVVKLPENIQTLSRLKKKTNNVFRYLGKKANKFGHG